MTQDANTAPTIPTPTEVQGILSMAATIKLAKEESGYQQMRASVIAALQQGVTANIELCGPQIPRLISELEAVGWVTTVTQARGTGATPTLTVRSHVLSDDNLTTL